MRADGWMHESRRNVCCCDVFVVDVDGPYQVPNTLERIYFLLRFAVRTNSTASSEETVSPSCGL